jgi:hypothetical protein
MKFPSEKSVSIMLLPMVTSAQAVSRYEEGLFLIFIRV